MATSNHVVISKSRSKTQPFKVTNVAENAKSTGTGGETFTTRRNCIKNLLANMQIFHGTHVDVLDKTGKEPKWFALGKDGLETPREPDEVS